MKKILIILLTLILLTGCTSVQNGTAPDTTGYEKAAPHEFYVKNRSPEDKNKFRSEPIYVQGEIVTMQPDMIDILDDTGHIWSIEPETGEIWEEVQEGDHIYAFGFVNDVLAGFAGVDFVFVSAIKIYHNGEFHYVDSGEQIEQELIQE